MNKQVLGLGLAMLACAGALYIPAKTLADDDFDMGAINDWAKDYSGGIGFEESSGGDGVRMSGTDTEVNQSEIFPDMESDREQEMADRMADSYGDDEAFSAHAQEFSTELSQHPDTSQGDAYDLVMGSVRSEGGDYEVESHGCTITRSPASDMTYLPNAPTGSRIEGDLIDVEEETCKESYIGDHGAKCELVDSETECIDIDNTKTVRSAVDMKVQKQRSYVRYSGNADRSDTLEKQVELWYQPEDNVGGNKSDDRLWIYLRLDFNNIKNLSNAAVRIKHGDGLDFEGVRDSISCSGSRCTTIITDLEHTSPSWGGVPGYGYNYRTIGVSDTETNYGPSAPEIGVGEFGVQAVVRGQLHEIRKFSDQDRLSIYEVEIIGSDYNIPDNDSVERGDFPRCDRNYDPVILGQLCDDYVIQTLTPDFSEKELKRLWSTDDSSNVCWRAGTRATCKIETEEPLDINMDSLFDDDGFNVELEALMGDCELVEREVTNTTTTSYMERGDCSIPQQPIFEPCTLTREYETTKDEDGNITSVSPIWSGSSRCQRIADNIDDHPECDYSIEYGSSSCIVADGEQICSCEDEGTQETLVWDDWAHGNGPLINEDVEDAHAYFTDSHELIIDGIGTLNISLSDFSGVETHTEYEFTGNVRSVSDNTVQINGEIVEIEQCPIITYLEESSQFFDPYSSTVEISEIVCPTPNDTTCTTEQDSDGNTHEVCFAPDQVETACAGMIADGENDCQLTERRCAFTSVHPLGEYCAEEETLYECEITTAWEDSQVEEVMDCGDGEFYCVDGSCLDPDLDQGNDGFGEAAAMLTAVQQMEQDMDCEDPEDLSTCKFFSGDHAYCRQGRGSFSSVWDCCDLEGGEDEWGPDAYIGAAIGIGMMVDPDMESVAELMGPVVGDQVAEEIAAAMSGIGTAYLAYQVISGEMLDNFSNLLQLAIPCYPREYELDMAGDKSSRHYLGKRCGKSIDVGFSTWCIRRDRHYCSWDGPVGRIITGEANKQLGRDFGTPRTPTCEGLSLDDMETINWSELDLSEWEDILRRTGNMPPRDDFGEVDVDSQVEGVPENPGGVDPL